MDEAKYPVYDCDVHAVLPSIDALLPYLPSYWREQVAQTGFKGPVDHWHPPQYPTATRSKGGLAASDVGTIRLQVLQSNPRPAVAILSCDCAIETLHNPDAAAAMATAVNDWISAEWIGKDPRIRASIVVPSAFPELAVREIEKRAGQRGFVQVLLPVRSESPYGSRNFRPVFAAAASHGLPVALHYGGVPGTPSTPVGWPSYFMEEYAGMPGAFQAQLMSIIAGGVFDEHRGLRLVLAEGGFAWLPSLLWRFDKNWKGLRRELPWVRRPPSEYVREHVRLTTAPLDAPSETSELLEVIGQLGSDDMLLYASDYPHDHGEPEANSFWASLPSATLRKIRSDNPRALYGD
jgi:hypothetical protein